MPDIPIASVSGLPASLLPAADAVAAISRERSALARRFVLPPQQDAQQPAGADSRRQIRIPEDRGEHDGDGHCDNGSHQDDHDDRWQEMSGIDAETDRERPDVCARPRLPVR